MKGQKSLRQNVVLNIIKTLMSLVFPLITFPYVSRILNPDGIGKVNFSRSIISYFSIIAALGVKTYGIREAAKVRDNKQALSIFAQELFTINIISTLIAYILLAITIFTIPRLETYRPILYICSSVIFFETLGIEWLFSAVEDFFYITVRSVLLQVICLALLFIFVKTKEDFLYYAAITVFSSVGANIFNFIHSKKYITLRHIRKLQLKQHLKPICILFGMSVTISVYTILDTTMLGFLTNDFQVGLYTAATKINRIILSVVTSIGVVMQSRLSYYVGHSGKSEFNDLVYKSIDAMFMVAIPCAVGLCIVAKPTVLIFSGQAYEAAIPIMRIMNPIIVIIGLGSLLGAQIFIPMGKEKYTLISVLIGAVSNFTLNLLLIPHYHALGAAISTVLAETFVTTTQLVFARKIFNLTAFFTSFCKYFFYSIIMACIIIIPYRHIENQTLQLLLTIVLGAAVYFALLIATKTPLLIDTLKGIQKKIVS